MIIDIDPTNRDEVMKTIDLLQSYLTKKYRITSSIPTEMRVPATRVHWDAFDCTLREAKTQVLDYPMDWKLFPDNWREKEIENFVEKMKDLDVVVEVCN